MRRITIPIAILAAVVAAAAIVAPRRILPRAGASTRSFGAPVTFRNLSLVPVVDDSARPTDAYITLDEGLKAKTVTVRAESAKSGKTRAIPLNDVAHECLSRWRQQVTGNDVVDISKVATLFPIAMDCRLLPVQHFADEDGEDAGFIDFLKLSFGQKRKTLLNNLKARYSDTDIRAALQKAGARADVRAEALPLEKAAAMSRLLGQKQVS